MIQVVKILLAGDESSSMINSKDEDGWAPLHSAASIGNTEIAEMLLSKGKGFWGFRSFRFMFSSNVCCRRS